MTYMYIDVHRCILWQIPYSDSTCTFVGRCLATKVVLGQIAGYIIGLDDHRATMSKVNDERGSWANVILTCLSLK